MSVLAPWLWLIVCYDLLWSIVEQKYNGMLYYILELPFPQQSQVAHP